MKKPKKLYYDLVLRLAEQSECLSRHVGAIIVKDGRIISEGWNSPPSKCLTTECLRCNAKKKDGQGQHLEKILCAHAEVGAISTAAYLGVPLKDSVLYCSTKPCAECAKLIVAVGIKEVFYIQPYISNYTDLIFSKSEVNHGLLIPED